MVSATEETEHATGGMGQLTLREEGSRALQAEGTASARCQEHGRTWQVEGTGNHPEDGLRAPRALYRERAVGNTGGLSSASPWRLGEDDWSRRESEHQRRSQLGGSCGLGEREGGLQAQGRGTTHGMTGKQTWEGLGLVE